MSVFVAFATLYIALVVRGIVTSLLHQGALPAASLHGDCHRPPQSCADGLRALRSALDAKTCSLEQAGTEAERRWDDFAIGWQRELAALRAECCLTSRDAPADRAPLARAAVDLEKLGRLYTTHLVQYAREIGPTAERCAGDLAVMSSGGQAPTSSPAHP